MEDQYHIEEYNDIFTDSKKIDHIFFIFSSKNCEIKTKLENRLKTNISIPPNLVPCTPNEIIPDIIIYVQPNQRNKNDRITYLKLITNSILEICKMNNYHEIVINFDIRNLKHFFNFKFFYKKIFKYSQIKSKLYLNKVMDVFDLEEILEILNVYHNSSLAGHTSFEKKTENAIRRYYFWPSMNKDLKKFIERCEICKNAKITRHTQSPMLITSTSEFPFQKV